MTRTVYGLKWTGTYTITDKLFANKEKAQAECDRRNKKVMWFRRVLLHCKYIVWPLTLEE